MGNISKKFKYLIPKERSANHHQQLNEGGRDWENMYRDRWSFDKVVRSTHGVNCTGPCSWNIYVKNELVAWENQVHDCLEISPEMQKNSRRGWTTKSSEFLSKKSLKYAGPMFHLGLFMTAGGHFIEILIPKFLTDSTSVDVYTHGKMLPAHYYPKLKKYKNFVGNYGNAWHLQQKEFEKFNGAILLTTNCLVLPKESYKDKVFTTGAVAFEGCKHIEKVDGKKKFYAAD